MIMADIHYSAVEYSYVLLALVLLFFVFIRIRRSWKLLSSGGVTFEKSGLGSKVHSGEKSQGAVQSMGVVEPLQDLNWETAEPKRIYRFNPKFFLTMGLQSTTINHITHIDKLYLSRLAARRKILEDHPDAVACLPSAIGMVNELYTYLTSTYLPQRYPNIFHLKPSRHSATHLFNALTMDLLPLTPHSDPLVTLRSLVTTVDDDFIMLLPASTSPESPPDHSSSPSPNPNAPPSATNSEEESSPNPFSLQAHIWCYPAGFHPRNLLGLPLAEIHAPVPGYASKLARSMDRYFSRLEVGRVMTRINWSIATTPNLWEDGLSGSAHHLYEDDEKLDRDLPGQNSSIGDNSNGIDNDVDISKCYLRCELQTLFALPVSGGRILALHLYMYPLEDIKSGTSKGAAGGNGSVADELCEAIDGLKRGNVPEMWRYKRAVIWGERVKKYLRS